VTSHLLNQRDKVAGHVAGWKSRTHICDRETSSKVATC